MQVSQGGTYSVRVTNPGGSVTSVPVNLSVMPLLEVAMVPAVYLNGGIGVTYRIEYENAIGSTNVWTPLAMVTLTNSPQVYFDLSAAGQPGRVYRLVQGN